MRLLLYVLIILFSFSILAEKSPKSDLKASAKIALKDVTNSKKLSSTKEQKAYLKDFKQAYAIFKDQAGSFNEEILTQIKMEYQVKSKFLKNIYKELTDEMLEDEKIKREQAIDVMERFVKKYPNNLYIFEYPYGTFASWKLLYFAHEQMFYRMKRYARDGIRGINFCEPSFNLRA